MKAKDLKDIGDMGCTKRQTHTPSLGHETETMLSCERAVQLRLAFLVYSAAAFGIKESSGLVGMLSLDNSLSSIQCGHVAVLFQTGDELANITKSDRREEGQA